MEFRRWQRELTEIPAPPFGEAARSEWLRQRFIVLGLEEVSVDELGNVFGLLLPDDAAPLIGVSAHLDTVFPPGTRLDTREDGDRLYGPGISDNAAGIVALLLTFAGLAPIRFFIGFLLANIAVFLFVFWPLQQRLPLPALEALVALIDATSIWLLSRIPALQGDSYRRVSWVFAGIASLIGNAASFCIGVMASGEPWKTHGAGE